MFGWPFDDGQGQSSVNHKKLNKPTPTCITSLISIIEQIGQKLVIPSRFLVNYTMNEQRFVIVRMDGKISKNVDNTSTRVICA